MVNEKHKAAVLIKIEKSMNSGPILIVDDDQGIRAMLTTVLEEEGYNVVLATNGQEALNLIQQQRPALVLLDLMMPVMDGWQFLEAVKSQPNLKDLPILLLSASRNIISTAHKTHVKAYLSKPFELDKLLSYVEQYQRGV